MIMHYQQGRSRDGKHVLKIWKICYVLYREQMFLVCSSDALHSYMHVVSPTGTPVRKGYYPVIWAAHCKSSVKWPCLLMAHTSGGEWRYNKCGVHSPGFNKVHTICVSLANGILKRWRADKMCSYIKVIHKIYLYFYRVVWNPCFIQTWKVAKSNLQYGPS